MGIVSVLWAPPADIDPDALAYAYEKCSKRVLDKAPEPVVDGGPVGTLGTPLPGGPATGPFRHAPWCAFQRASEDGRIRKCNCPNSVLSRG